MKNNNSFYNASNFKYFRRYIKPITINRALINMIESKEDELKSQTITSETNKDNINIIENNINQRERLEKLNQIARKELYILSNDKNIIGIEKNNTLNNI